MNYAEMSDYHINNLVHNQLLEEPFLIQFNNDGSINWIKNNNTIVTTVDVKYTKNGLHDYCNSWADAGPIIEKENISLTCHQSRDEWAAIFNRHCMSANQNPLRAAMECFLMIKESK